MNASGSFFRGLELGGNGNNTLNGGLRMQIAGKISNETFISGVVTDETLPIQPDGSTADLDELDKVFIQIDNPKFSIVAGDIETHEEHVSINTFERKLIGLDNKIEFNDRVIRSVIGQSKGTYQRLEIKGQDGNQGPYYLTTVDGLSNTVVSSGSEKVWLNGVLLKRGEDLDYTIDYSKGEVYFTSKNLIYFLLSFFYPRTCWNTSRKIVKVADVIRRLRVQNCDFRRFSTAEAKSCLPSYRVHDLKRKQQEGKADSLNSEPRTAENQLLNRQIR